MRNAMKFANSKKGWTRTKRQLGWIFLRVMSLMVLLPSPKAPTGRLKLIAPLVSHWGAKFRELRLFNTCSFQKGFEVTSIAKGVMFRPPVFSPSGHRACQRLSKNSFSCRAKLHRLSWVNGWDWSYVVYLITSVFYCQNVQLLFGCLLLRVCH